MELFLTILWWYYTFAITVGLIAIVFTDNRWSLFDNIGKFEKEIAYVATYVYLTIEYWG